MLYIVDSWSGNPSTWRSFTLQTRGVIHQESTWSSWFIMVSVWWTLNSNKWLVDVCQTRQTMSAMKTSSNTRTCINKLLHLKTAETSSHIQSLSLPVLWLFNDHVTGQPENRGERDLSFAALEGASNLTTHHTLHYCALRLRWKNKCCT